MTPPARPAGPITGIMPDLWRLFHWTRRKGAAREGTFSWPSSGDDAPGVSAR